MPPTDKHRCHGWGHCKEQTSHVQGTSILWRTRVKVVACTGLIQGHGHTPKMQLKAPAAGKCSVSVACSCLAIRPAQKLLVSLTIWAQPEDGYLLLLHTFRHTPIEAVVFSKRHRVLLATSWHLTINSSKLRAWKAKCYHLACFRAWAIFATCCWFSGNGSSQNTTVTDKPCGLPSQEWRNILWVQKQRDEWCYDLMS